ncbi:glycyl radical protein [candidate division KSB1 bacterium]|nr:glycyl radical protein [candidate division KSB1 bacterium]
MNKRIAALRKQSVETQPTISPQRAVLMTQFYKSTEGKLLSPVMRRALAFQYLMENKTIRIEDGELIVGERGSRPRVTPTYPEICCHTLEELDVLNSREKVAYTVDDKTKEIYEDMIIPYWYGKTIREKIFDEMTGQWLAAYHAGIFTEFMEQRAPGHTALDDTIYKKGLLGLLQEIQHELEQLDYLTDRTAYEKRDQLHGMAICAGAIIHYAERYSKLATQMAQQADDPFRRQELETIAEICQRVPANPPQSFWEALQAYWFIHVGVITELNTWDAISPGRLDQHLFPFYQAERSAGSLSGEQAKELLSALFIKFNNQPAPPKVGVTAQESGTYNDFALISVGGLTPDGNDATNPVSYLILDVLNELKLVQPHCCIQLSQQNPDRLLKRGLEINKSGFGQPSFFSTEAIVQELTGQGKSMVDARCGGTSGCVESGAFGKENYNLTGYFNLPKVLEITLNNGTDPRTGKRIGIETGDAESFKTFDELYLAFEKQLTYFIDVKVQGNNIIERIYETFMPAPFLSLLIQDCIRSGKDYHAGGARYNTSYIQGVGLGTVTDAFSAIRFHIFEKQTITMKELLMILHENYEGYERIRQLFMNKTPRYGNDDDAADNIMRHIFETFFTAVDGRKNMKGGTYHINLLPTTVHVYFGSITGATSDGRKAGQVLSEGVSPVQGMDRNGPTAVLHSVSKMDHLRTGGTLLNQKFTPQLLANESGIAKIGNLIRTYFKMNGHHIQFNVVTADTLHKAQAEPDKYRDLIVRVAGYSDYFCNLNADLQNEIIARTEHGDLE